MAACLIPVEEGFEEQKNGAGIAVDHNRGVNYFVCFPFGSLHECPRSNPSSKMSICVMAKRIMAFRRCGLVEAIEVAKGLPDVNTGSSALEKELPNFYSGGILTP